MLDNMRKLRRIARVGLGHGIGAAMAPISAVRSGWMPRAGRFLIAPQDIRTSDPTRATDFHSGFFVFAGRAIDCGDISPFDIEPPSDEWLRTLISFGWLRHLRAAKRDSASLDAQKFVQDFINRPLSWALTSANLSSAAKRLLSLLSQSPMLLEGADHNFYLQLLHHLDQLRRMFERALARPMPDYERLMLCIALVYYALCVEVQQSFANKAISRLRRELTRQMLPDGGHISRNPAFMLELLLDLLPLRQVFVARGLAAPLELMSAIDRMVPMLRMFRHGDGTLALFNGMGVTSPDNLAAVLAYDEGRNQPILNARYSGYQRLQGGSSLAIIDVGAPPTANASRLAHAGALSFEFSDGDCRIIVNCGVPELGSKNMREAARASAAHSTLILDNVSSAAFAGNLGLESLIAGEIIHSQPIASVDRDENGEFPQIRAQHYGYKSAFGVVHTRRMAVSDNGHVLFGNDELTFAIKATKTLNLPFALRFHLHPDVQAVVSHEGATVFLQLANKKLWRMEAGGLPLTLEESVLFASPTGPKPSRQIVVHAIAETEMQLSWSLSRVEVSA